MRFVGVKSPEQQSVQVLHRTRLILTRQRTGLGNAIRAHLAEFGIIAPIGRLGLDRLLAVIGDESDDRLPPPARACLAMLADQYRQVLAHLLETDRAIRADRMRLGDVERDAPVHRRAPRDERLHAEIFGGQHLQIVERARHHGGDDDRAHGAAFDALEREKLMQPHGIFVGGAACIGGDAPAGADHGRVAALRHQREDDIGIAGVNGKQHTLNPGSGRCRRRE